MTIIIFILGVSISIWYVDKKITPTIIQIAERKTTEFATRAINSAVRFAEDYEFNEVFDITYDNEGNVVTYNWNPAVVSEINRVATDRVEEYFQNMNRGDPIAYDYSLQEPYDYSDGAKDRAKLDPTLIEIPLGEVTGNTVLANLGPKIPINLELVGAVKTNVKRETEPFGITGSWVTLYIDVQADVQIIIPFISKVESLQTEIYIDGGAIIGDVPEFYGGGGEGPSISVPKSDFENENADLQDDE
ncbi:sporulation protein YunB [Oceanobacillus piezotolerans]|uniref:Sporulation protein YunB n=2 Tax=Oceanobacillus piezotolerans TaxID=2448030 RepID=A0A498DC93_9BACI|nr:sporulation protein YunB [Oceanobacillus piezotolerans]